MMVTSTLIFWVYIVYLVLRAVLFNVFQETVDSKEIDTPSSKPKEINTPSSKPKIKQPSIENRKLNKADSAKKPLTRPRSSVKKSPNIRDNRVKSSVSPYSQKRNVSAPRNDL